MSAVPVIFVVPLHKAINPVASSPNICKWLGWVTGPVFQGSEDGFSKRVIITYMLAQGGWSNNKKKFMVVYQDKQQPMEATPAALIL